MIRLGDCRGILSESFTEWKDLTRSERPEKVKRNDEKQDKT